jgi:outer membrane protein, heavy metal efflux system
MHVKLGSVTVAAAAVMLASCRNTTAHRDADSVRRSVVESVKAPLETTPTISALPILSEINRVSYDVDTARNSASEVDRVLAVSLNDAIAMSLDRDPALVTLRANEPVAHAAYHVAERYPFNPTIQVQVLPYAHDKAGDQLSVKNSITVNQTLELAHQQRYREGSAAASWNQVRWNIVQAELTSVVQAERLFFTAVYQRELLDLARRGALLSDDLLGIIERRFIAGLATASEQKIGRVTARQSHRQAELAEANFKTALLAMHRQLNMSTELPIDLAQRLEDFTWLPLLPMASQTGGDSLTFVVTADFVADLVNRRPDIMAAQSSVDVARANLALARANLLQNPGVGPSYERDESGTLFFGMSAQVNLPVWDNGRPLAAQREAEVQQQMIVVSQLRARASIEAQTAIERYERARLMVERSSSDRLRATDTDLQDIKNQFAAGQADIINVFATQNALLQEQRAYLDLLNELAQAAADVTLAAGIPPVQFVTTSTRQSPNMEQLPAP